MFADSSYPAPPRGANATHVHDQRDAGDGAGGGSNGAHGTDFPDDAAALTVVQVAVRLNCSPRTIERAISAGELKSIPIGARSRRILLGDLRNYLEGRRRKGRPR